MLKAAILGAGACCRKMLPGLRSAFDIRTIYDPRPSPRTVGLLSECERLAIVSSESEFYVNATAADAVFVLSPPTEHVRQLEAASVLGVPIFVEKPLAVDWSEISRIERLLERSPRIYFSDFFVDVRGTLLQRTLGKRMRENEWIVPYVFTVCGEAEVDRLASSIGEVKQVCCRLLEGAGEGKSVTERAWLKDQRGGGVLLDLAYHYFTLCSVLFDAPLDVRRVRLGVHKQGTEGYDFETWTERDESAETYAKIFLRSAAGLDVQIEVAKNWTSDCRELVIKGSRGEVGMDFGSSQELNNVQTVNIVGKKSSVAIAQNYWDLVTKGFLHYINS
jgi:predicted dehydrogenase